MAPKDTTSSRYDNLGDTFRAKTGFPYHPDFLPFYFPIYQVQEHSPGHKAGLEAYFDFIVAVGNTRLVNGTLEN